MAQIATIDGLDAVRLYRGAADGKNYKQGRARSRVTSVRESDRYPGRCVHNLTTPVDQDDFLLTNDGRNTGIKAPRVADLCCEKGLKEYVAGRVHANLCCVGKKAVNCEGKPEPDRPIPLSPITVPVEQPAVVEPVEERVEQSPVQKETQREIPVQRRRGKSSFSIPVFGREGRIPFSSDEEKILREKLNFISFDGKTLELTSGKSKRSFDVSESADRGKAENLLDWSATKVSADEESITWAVLEKLKNAIWPEIDRPASFIPAEEDDVESARKEDESRKGSAGGYKSPDDTGKPMTGMPNFHGLEEAMSDIMEFPPMYEDGMGSFGEMIPAGYIKANLVGGGSILGQKVVNDLVKLAFSKFMDPGMGRDLAIAGTKLALGVVGGRFAYKYNDVAGVAMSSNAIATLIYDDLLKPMVLSKHLPTVFGAVTVEETRLLGNLSNEERLALSAFDAIGVEDIRGLNAIGVEDIRGLGDGEESEYGDEMVELGAAEEVVIGNFNPNLLGRAPVAALA